MKYYKNSNEELFSFDDDITDAIIKNIQNRINDTLVEISKEEFDKVLEPTPEEALLRLKFENERLRSEAVKGIIVTYNGVNWHGDEESQGRLVRAISSLSDNVETILWKGKDDVAIDLNRLDLKEILRLSVEEQTSLWFKDFTE